MGRVFDVDGKAVEGVFVMLIGSGDPGEKAIQQADEEVRKTEGAPQRELYALHAANSDGSFRIDQVTPGLTYTLVALNAHREPVRSRPVTAPSSAAVELRFVRQR